MRWSTGSSGGVGRNVGSGDRDRVLIQTWGQKYTTATRAALIFSLEPVFAWLTSYVVEHEVLTGQALAGAGCILGGILLVELKPLERRGQRILGI